MSKCIFEHDKNICLALNIKKCENCRFYKSEDCYKRIYKSKKFIGVEKKRG